MMDFISVPLVVGICVAGVYGLFELYARRKERLAIIEKLADRVDLSSLTGNIYPPLMFKSRSFSALKVGCLLAGLGLGLLIGCLINITMVFPAGNLNIRHLEIISTVYGSCVLLFGGLGLLIAFILENKMSKKDSQDKQA
jgi:hypothetical protein